jgi:peptidoglycan/LPS O-acetylase OafA/YrhL
MSLPRTGLLDSDNWDDIKTDLANEMGGDKTSHTYWKPESSTRFRLRIYNLLGRPRSEPANPRPTAYLDGMRGFAALLVYWHHHELKAHMTSGQVDIFEHGFGYQGNYYFAALPMIRHFFSGGHFAVSIFLVLSGCVLAIKPLNLVQAGDLLQLGDHLASSLFRRWIRMFLPLIITTLVYLTILHALGLWISGITKQGSWTAEVWAFYLEFKNFSFVFKDGGEPWLSYNTHLWTIPVEMRGSIVVFTTLMALSRCSTKMRLWVQAGLIVYFLYIADGWYCAMFVMGMLLCDLNLLAERSELPSLLASLEPYKTFIYYHLLALSLFLGGVPSMDRDVGKLSQTRGWYYLSYLKPQAVFDYKWFYLFWAATLFVAATPHVAWLKRFFETRFCQYLGRISFALYMVHGPVLETLGERLYAAAGWVTEEKMQHIPRWCNLVYIPRVGPVGLELSFLLPHLIIFPVTFGIAEIVTRFVDSPSQKFAAWLYKQTVEDVPFKRARA